MKNNNNDGNRLSVKRAFYLLSFTIIALSINFISANAQLHNTPTCAPNVVTGLDWGSGVGQSNWTPTGGLTYSTIVDGHTFTYTFTGNTGTLADGSPYVSTELTTNNELTLYTNGIGVGNITITIDISPPIESDIGMSIYHINTGGLGGDKFTVSASYLGGSAIYPTFTTPASPDYTSNATGVLDATTVSSVANGTAGLNWTAPSIDKITIVWEECSTCSTNYHGMSLGSIDFCSCAYSGTFQAESACSFFDTDAINLTHNNDHNSSGTHTQTYALTDNTGQILVINSSPNFAAQVEGTYQVHAVNYETAEGISNYNVGNNISSVTGDCIYTSSVSFSVCSCSFKTQQPIIVNAAGGSIGDADMTIRYVLTDNSGVMLGISPNSALAGQAEGAYLIYSLAYDTAQGISNLTVGNNISAVTGSCFDLSSSLSIGVCGTIPTCARYESFTKH
ncbi:MAG: hypothetical protein AB8B69_14365 [Chitinophagales bacterium]